jgi:hypothetical protein
LDRFDTQIEGLLTNLENTDSVSICTPSKRTSKKSIFGKLVSPRYRFSNPVPILNKNCSVETFFNIEPKKINLKDDIFRAKVKRNENIIKKC